MINRKLGAIAASALLASSIAACGSSSSTSSSAGGGAGGTPSGPAPVGTYSTKITNEALANGVWALTFHKNGSYTITRNGSSKGTLVTGKGSIVRGNTLTINPLLRGSCAPSGSTGTYTLKLSGRALQLIKVKDPCVTRSEILARTYTKTGK